MDGRRGDVTLSLGARDALMRVSGVVSVGIGRGSDGEPAVIVGVRTESAATHIEMPGRIEGLPVIVRSVGEIGSL
ncbi:MAG: hypothetical protein RQ731_05675 [Anaerosomatales bacterium]|nr:hypothetical protein [Anaerosomatales bacterium]MDT8434227.1 hypothetical protein [Anaerosomatales bacterium]